MNSDFKDISAKYRNVFDSQLRVSEFWKFLHENKTGNIYFGRVKARKYTRFCAKRHECIGKQIKFYLLINFGTKPSFVCIKFLKS